MARVDQAVHDAGAGPRLESRWGFCRIDLHRPGGRKPVEERPRLPFRNPVVMLKRVVGFRQHQVDHDDALALLERTLQAPPSGSRLCLR